MFDTGTYTLAEVAQYTGVKPMTLRAWFHPRSDKQGLGPIFTSDYAKIDDDFAVSFLNLIEAYVASFFKKNGVKHLLIRRTHTLLQRSLGMSHPFAFANLAVGLGNIARQDSDQRYCEVISRQLLFPEFNEGLHRISYDSETHLANGCCACSPWPSVMRTICSRGAVLITRPPSNSERALASQRMPQ